jgi:hypothetical protein
VSELYQPSDRRLLEKLVPIFLLIELYTESPNSPTPKKVRQVKSKVMSMLITIFDIKGTVHKEFVLAGQTTNSAYYCDVL